MLIEAGFDYGTGCQYPASGLEGNLLRVPLHRRQHRRQLDRRVQIDGGFYNRLSITEPQRGAARRTC